MAVRKTKEPTKELTEAETKAKQAELAAKIRQAPISEVAHKIKQCSDDGGKRCTDARFAIFLGAGASFQAKIKTAGQMMTEFREQIIKRDCPEITDKKKQEEWLKKNVLDVGEGNEYSKLFEAYERTRAGRQKYISRLIKDKIPTFGYAMLASIIARGFINTVLTTNFDDLMFIACNKFTGVRPVIYAYGIMATEMKFSSPHSKILKMHGDYLYSTLANTEDEMSRYNQDPNMKAQVAHALNEYELIVFGYSGSDDSVMEILESYPGGKEFYWCHWSKELPSVRALELLYEKKGTLVAIEGFDDAMYDIYKIIDFELDEVLASYEERRNEIRRFIDVFKEKYPNTIIEESIQETKQSEYKPKVEPSTWFEYFEAAKEALKEKNFVTAESNYRTTIKLNPYYDYAYTSLGNLLAQDKTRLKEAEEMFREAVKLNPKDSYANSVLADLLAQDQTRLKEAEEIYRKVIKSEPTYGYAYTSLGRLLEQDKARLNEAEEIYRKIIEIKPDYKYAYYSLGKLLGKDNTRLKEAEEIYREIIELEPNYEFAYTALGTLLVQDKTRLKEAEEIYRKAIEVKPDYIYAYTELGDLLAKDNARLKEAEEIYKKLIGLNPNNASNYYKLGVLLQKQNKIDDALETYQVSAKLDEFFVHPRISLAGINKKLGRKKESKKYADEAFAVIKEDFYYGLACLNSIADNKEEAITNLKLAIEKDSMFTTLAKESPGLEWIRDDERFWEIVGRDIEK